MVLSVVDCTAAMHSMATWGTGCDISYIALTRIQQVLPADMSRQQLVLTAVIDFDA